MSDVLSKIKAFNKNANKEVYIEELDVTIYFTIPTTGEMQKINKWAEEVKGDLSTYLIVEKARDKEGKKVFNIDNIKDIEQLPFNISNKICEAILGNISNQDLKKS
jgi:hypothetical protein